MPYIEIIKNFFNSQFISTIIGVLIGGILTIFISNITERRKICMGLKIEVWKRITIYLDYISKALTEIETDIEQYENEEETTEELLKSLDKHGYIISQAIPHISREINKNILIIQSNENFTDEITKNCQEALRYILDVKEGKIKIERNLSKIKNSIEKLEDSHVYLYGNLQSTLLEDLYTRRQINNMDITE